MSNNLDLDQVADNQNSKETTINDQAAQLDAAMTEVLDVPVDNTNAETVSNDDFRRYVTFVVDEDGGSPATAAITLTVPAIKRGLFCIVNNTAFDVTVTISGQPVTAPVIPANKTAILQSDGTNVRQPQASSRDFVIPYDVGGHIEGVPGSSQILLDRVLPREVVFASGLADSAGLAGVAATAQTDFDLQKNGASFGTMRFAASGTVATFIAASDAVFSAGDRLTIVAPSSADATLADVKATLGGLVDVTG